MDKSLNYQEILAAVVRREVRFQSSLSPIRIAAVCDHESGQYVLLATGWQNKQRVHWIIFHACLHNGKIILESDNTEEGLEDALIEASIFPDDIISASYGDSVRDAELIAA